MKIQKTNALHVECNNEVYLNTYVSSWSGNVELKFNTSQMAQSTS
jgi:hypothetical protein